MTPEASWRSSRRDAFSIEISNVDTWDPPEGQKGEGLLLQTNRGDVRSLLHSCSDTDKAIVWVWGAHGGFDGPADGIYGLLSEELKAQGITSLRVDYRQPRELGEAVLDTLAGVSFLTGRGYQRLALVGHSLGGAVVISAAILDPLVRAVVALSSQTYGAKNVAQVSPRPLLLVHGGDDTRLPPYCSEMIYSWARQPKELVIYPGAGHGLRQCKEELHQLLKTWLVKKLES